MDRAEEFAGRVEDAEGIAEEELAAIGDALAAYEAKGWRNGKVPGGYSIHAKGDIFAAAFDLSPNRTTVYMPLPAIFPGHEAPITARALARSRFDVKGQIRTSHPRPVTHDRWTRDPMS